MSDTEPDLDLGASGLSLELWKAREAVRQGDAKLTHQGQSFDGLRAQATSLLGWSVTIGTGLAAVALSGRSTAAGTAIVLMTTTTAFFSVKALQVTSAWKYPSYDPLQILDHEETSELRILQSLAIGTTDAIKQNRGTLTVRSRRLRNAWVSFSLIPAVGLGLYLVTR